MFWKRVHRIVDGLRFKATLGFGMLLAGSAAICLASTVLLLDRSLRRELDARLETELEEMYRICVTGADPTQTGRRLQLAAVSEAEHTALQQKFPGGILLEVFEKKSSLSRFRFFYIAANGEVYQARINADGSVFSRLVPFRQRRRILAADFMGRVRNEGGRRLQLRFYDADGALAAAAPRTELEPEPREKNGPGFVVRSRRLFDGSRIEAARSTTDIEKLLTELLRLQGSIFLILLCIVVPCGWLLSRRLLGGVVRVSSAAKRIATDGDFRRRVEHCGGGSEITELVSAFNTMNDNNRRLFEAQRSITDNVAHELKTPLTRLRSAAEVTLGKDPAGEGGELAAVVSEEAADMLALINSMLEITRTESGLALIAHEPVNLSEMLRRARELFLPIAEDMRIEFTLEIPPEPLTVSADRVRLQRVFANLIDNALKFSDPGGKLHIRLGSDGDRAKVSVTDTGCGIAAEELPHIFERLYRCDASRSRPGSGLGLTLAAAIVRAHGGEIQVESVPGRGSTFTVILPRG